MKVLMSKIKNKYKHLAARLADVLLVQAGLRQNVGGYGIFVRLMRDYGFNFEWYDKYCENLFAKGFEQKQEKYDVLTAFELFEHLPDPMEDVTNLVEKSNVIIFSTSLLPNPTPQD